MTNPTNPNIDPTSFGTEQQNDSLHKLSQIVSGNQNLIDQPGLVQALFQGNATPAQSSTIDQFMGGLQAEVKVRAASMGGNKIDLSDMERQQLDAMGIQYQAVWNSPANQQADLTAQMAKQGLQPVMDANGKIQTDANGNPLAQKIPAKKKGRGFFGSIGHFLGNNPVTSLVTHGTLVPGSNDDVGNDYSGVVGVGKLANEGYTALSSLVSQNNELAHPAAYANMVEQNGDLMKQLGYDPGNPLSVIAFNAKGYATTDTTSVANTWDTSNPTGLYGWNGPQAVDQAEQFLADPSGYRQKILADTTLSDQQKAAQLTQISSPQFVDLVKQVQGRKASIGNDFSRGIGLDPVRDATAFKVNSVGTDLLASFFIDPLAVGLGAYTNALRTKTAISGFTDATGIGRVLDESVSTDLGSYRAQQFLHDVVQAGNRIHDALESGDMVTAAAVEAGLAKSNPFAGLLPAALGKDQILETMSEAEARQVRTGELAERTGLGDRLDTYDKMVSYIVSKNALMRLQGGLAPIESSHMPGALSSLAYKRTRAAVAEWRSVRSTNSVLKAQDKLLQWATDPDRVEQSINDGLLKRALPEADDAVDAATGTVIAAPAADDGLASAQRGQFELTAAGKGEAAFNMRAYGKPTPGKSFQLGNTVIAPGAFTPKAIAARARLAAARFTNQLPHDRAISLTASDSVDTLRKTLATYMTPGDVNLLATRWALEPQSRKEIAQGVGDMLAHASGMTRTKAGQEIVKTWKTQSQKYATNGRGVLDANGTEAAMYPGQVQEHFVLPNFGQMHQAAAKVGLFEATLGNILDIPALAHALGIWRTWVLGPVTAYRAIIESWANAGANGLFKDAAQAKAMLREHGGLDGLAGRSRAIGKLASLGSWRQISQMYRAGLVKQFDEADAAEFKYYIENIQQPRLLDQVIAHTAAQIDPAGQTGIAEAAGKGLIAKHFTVDPTKGWSPELRNVRAKYELTDELDGMAGASRYVDALAQRVNKSPDLAKAIIERLQGGEGYGTDKIVSELEKPAVKRLMDQTPYGHIYWDANGIQQNAITDAEITLGKAQFADRLTAEFRELTTGRNGVLNDKLLNKIAEDGKAPSEEWLHANVKGLWRPKYVLAPVYEAVEPSGSVGNFLKLIEKPGSDMYQLLVERPIQRHATSPLHAAAYMSAKKDLEGYRAHLIEDGLTEGTAQKITAGMADRTAWSRVARMVDDPRLKMQMDVVGRSFFAFSRATTMMIRRWATTAWANPAAARKMQLSAEAAVHAGLVQKDTNGNWVFKVPMSGVAMDVINDAMRHIPGFSDAAGFPAADLTGNVTSIVPGSTDPFQYGTTPLVSIGGRQLASMFPPDAREVFDRLDSLFNGAAGQGRGIADTLEPTIARRITEVLDDDQRNSMTSSAMIGSLYNLYATGQVPPEGASDVEWDDFYRKLKTQTKNQLFVRAAFALFSPARLSNVEDEGPQADYAYQLTGAKGLRDEFKQLLNDNKGDFASAMSIWAYMHPDETVYTESASQASTSGAVMPATQSALHWMNNNADFIQKYQHVSAFFIPEQSKGDPYSQAAYRAQLEAGLRERKTPTEFYQDVRKSTDGDVYYAMEDKYTADHDKALAEGNTTAAQSMNADWLAWSKQYKATHPIFANDLASWADTRNTAAGQLNDLHSMVKNGDVPDGMGPYVSGMLQAYDGYVAFAAAHPGSDSLAKAQRSSAFAELQGYMTQVVQLQPGLKDLYQGVFRKLNSNLENENQG